MRQLCQIDVRDQAECLTDYLTSIGVDARCDEGREGFAVWVLDEDEMERARAELEKFLAEPDHERYAAAGDKAQQRREEQARRREAAARNVVEMRGRWKGMSMAAAWGAGPTRPAPWTIGLIIAAVAMSLMTNFAEPKDDFGRFVMEKAMIVEFQSYLSTGDLLVNLKRGEIWRAVTPIFLHGGMIHLAFNMIWLFRLGSIVETKFGATRYLLMVLFFAAFTSVSNVAAPMEPEWLADLLGSGPGIGMSGVGYGLFGFVWMQSIHNPRFGYRLSQFTVILMIGWLVYCFTPLCPDNVANVAHFTGLAAGVALGRSQWFHS